MLKRVVGMLFVLTMLVSNAFGQQLQAGRYYKTLTGSGAPSAGTCYDGTLYLDKTNFIFYSSTATTAPGTCTWLLIGKDINDTQTPTKSYQTSSVDLTLGATSGKNVADGTAYLASYMGNTHGSAMTKTGNYVAGVIGSYDIQSTNATHYPSGPVLG